MNWQLSFNLSRHLLQNHPELLRGMSDSRLKDTVDDFLAQATIAEVHRFYGWS